MRMEEPYGSRIEEVKVMERGEEEKGERVMDSSSNEDESRLMETWIPEEERVPGVSIVYCAKERVKDEIIGPSNAYEGGYR